MRDAIRRTAPARLGYAALALATIAVGLAVHLRGGSLPAAARDVAGDALWAAMVYWWLGAGWPRASPLRRAGAAVLFAYAVEFSQCYRAPWLDAARATTPGHLVLGEGFDPRDLLAYAAGVGAALAAELAAQRASRRR